MEQSEFGQLNIDLAATFTPIVPLPPTIPSMTTLAPEVRLLAPVPISPTLEREASVPPVKPSEATSSLPSSDQTVPATPTTISGQVQILLNNW